jgi:hypothetical protein
MKKGVQAITGKIQVKAGVWENYHVNQWYAGTPQEKRNEAHVKWAAYNITSGTPIKILEKDQGHFRFQPKAVGHKYLIVAYMYEPELSTGLEITVLPNEKPEILGVDLSDINDQPFAKPVEYGQTINCHARTVGMVGHHVVFALWEDNDTNSANNTDQSKHRLVIEKTTIVGSKGIAHAQFQAKPDFTKLSAAMSGTGSGKTQYYVTVFGLGMLKASAGTTPIYPDERKAATREHLEGKQPKTGQVAPYKEKIILKERGAIKKNKESHYSTSQSIEKEVLEVSLRDENGNLITNTFASKTLMVYIRSKGIINHKIQFKLYEEDYGSGHDILLNQEYTITGNDCKIMVHLDRIPKSRGGGLFEEGLQQEIYADVLVKDLKTHIYSKVINVDASVFKVEVPENKSMITVKKPEEKKGEAICYCKQKENQFYWSNKLTCDQRKKVLQVCKNLWPSSKPNERASELMAIMHLETGTKDSFKPYADNGAGFSGLIQFSDASAKALGTTRAKLKAMTFTEQMDYVEKYLSKNKSKLNTMTDLYLMVLKPNAVGQGSNPNYVLFDESIAVPDGDGSGTSQSQRMININQEPWVTKYGYASNPTYMLEEGEYVKRKKWVYTRQKFEQRWGFVNGKTIVKDVTDVLMRDHYNKGKPNVFVGKCENVKEEKKESEQTAPWMPFAVEELKTYGGVRQTESPLKERIYTYFDESSMPSGNNKTYWCGSFVNWCFEQVEDYKNTNSIANVAAFDWLPKVEAKKQRKDVDGWTNSELVSSIDDVFYGAVIVFSHSHVAFVCGQSKDGKSLIYLGGNQSDGKPNDGKGKRTISTNPILKSGLGTKFWIVKPINYSPTSKEKELPKVSADGKELTKETTR